MTTIKVIGLLCVAAGGLLAGLGITTNNVSFVWWIMTLFFIVFGIFLVIFGELADDN